MEKSNLTVKDLIEKVDDNQFIIHTKEGYSLGTRDFAITESTPTTTSSKIISIDFGSGDSRPLTLERLILVLTEFYGKEYLLELLSKLKSYDDVKDIILPTKSIRGV